MEQESAGARIVKTLLGIHPTELSRKQKLYLSLLEECERSFDRDYYLVKDARDELLIRGYETSEEHLRRHIRGGKIKVSRPSPRKTLIHKRELARFLLQERA